MVNLIFTIILIKAVSIIYLSPPWKRISFYIIFSPDLKAWTDDVDQPRNTSKDPLHVPNDPMTRCKTKALKEALNALVLNVSTKSELKGPLEYQEETLVHLIHVQEGSNTTLFRSWGEDSKGNKRILLQLGNNMGSPFPFVSRIKGLHGRL